VALRPAAVAETGRMCLDPPPLQCVSVALGTELRDQQTAVMLMIKG